QAPADTRGVFARHARCRGRDADRRNRIIGLAEDRRADAHGALVVLADLGGVADANDLLQLTRQNRSLDYGSTCDLAQWTLKIGGTLMLRQERKYDFTESRRVQGMHVSDPALDADGSPGLHDVDIDNVRTPSAHREVH